MVKDISYFYNFFVNTKKNSDKHKGYSEYGSRVMPILEEYSRLDLSKDRNAFKDALEKLLEDKDRELRKYGVDICLGFFILRSAIK